MSASPAGSSSTFPFGTLGTMSQPEVEAVLRDLAGGRIRFAPPARSEPLAAPPPDLLAPSDPPFPSPETQYRTLVEQIPAIIFIAYLDRGIGEAYVSPRIQDALGFAEPTRRRDPVRWFHQIHPDDRDRWSAEVAVMLVSGTPLRSAYRMVAQDGSTVWFHCEAKLVRQDQGPRRFIHGVAFDITELKEAEQALAAEGNLLSGILDSVGNPVIVLTRRGEISRLNRACEALGGHRGAEAVGHSFAGLFLPARDAERFESMIRELSVDGPPAHFEGDWLTKGGEIRRVRWSATLLTDGTGGPGHVIIAGSDLTERARMEHATAEISARVQRQIGQDLHDGLGQHLTGIAYLGKVLELKLNAAGLPEAAEAAKVVRLVNEAINQTRELARGLVPVLEDPDGLMTALETQADEVEEVFGTACRFECPEPVLIGDPTVATHVYHIAQDAITNAIHQGHAQTLVLSLRREGEEASLEIEDDGARSPDPRARYGGFGLLLMQYRAETVGGSLTVSSGPGGTTVVSCRFPIGARRDGDA